MASQSEPPLRGDEQRSDEGRRASGEGSASRPPPADRGAARFVERVVPVIFKRLVERAVESGVEKLSEQPENLRNFVAELKLPKEVLADVYGQIDDTKNGLYRVVAKELRDVLEHTQIAEEVVKVLTKLSFEIRTEIRFVPNDTSGMRGDDDPPPEDGGDLRPKITSQVTMREQDASDRTTKERGAQRR